MDDESRGDEEFYHIVREASRKYSQMGKWGASYTESPWLLRIAIGLLLFIIQSNASVLLLAFESFLISNPIYVISLLAILLLLSNILLLHLATSGKKRFKKLEHERMNEETEEREESLQDDRVDMERIENRVNELERQVSENERRWNQIEEYLDNEEHQATLTTFDLRDQISDVKSQTDEIDSAVTELAHDVEEIDRVDKDDIEDLDQRIEKNRDFVIRLYQKQMEIEEVLNDVGPNESEEKESMAQTETQSSRSDNSQQETEKEKEEEFE